MENSILCPICPNQEKLITYDLFDLFGNCCYMHPGDGAQSDYFGNSVDIDGDVAVVGAPAKNLKSFQTKLRTKGCRR